MILTKQDIKAKIRDLKKEKLAASGGSDRKSAAILRRASAG